MLLQLAVLFQVTLIVKCKSGDISRVAVSEEDFLTLRNEVSRLSNALAQNLDETRENRVSENDHVKLHWIEASLRDLQSDLAETTALCHNGSLDMQQLRRSHQRSGEWMKTNIRSLQQELKELRLKEETDLALLEEEETLRFETPKRHQRIKLHSKKDFQRAYKELRSQIGALFKNHRLLRRELTVQRQELHDIKEKEVPSQHSAGKDGQGIVCREAIVTCKNNDTEALKLKIADAAKKAALQDVTIKRLEQAESDLNDVVSRLQRESLHQRDLNKLEIKRLYERIDKLERRP